MKKLYHGQLILPRLYPILDTALLVARGCPLETAAGAMLEGGAGSGGDTMFKFELSYAGVFRVENFPAEQIQIKQIFPGFAAQRAGFDLGEIQIAQGESA